MVGIKDVARHAGVAIGTVSRVINNHSNVNPEIREKVLKSIKELGYVPNEVARSFKLRTTKMVALLIPSIWNPFFSQLAFYVEDELDKRGYKLLLCNSCGGPEKEMYYIEMLMQNKVAGVLGISYNENLQDIKNDIPFVSIDRKFPDGIPCVTADNFEGGAIAARKLIEKGCRNIAYLGTINPIESSVRNRKAGFIFAANELGINPIIFEKQEPIEDLNAFLHEFIITYSDVDGVFAITDLLAAHYIDKISKFEKKIPHDIKVIGFDGIQDTDLFHPILSTICQPTQEMAKIAVDLLIKKINKEQIEDYYVTIPVQYKEGETT